MKIMIVFVVMMVALLSFVYAQQGVVTSIIKDDYFDDGGVEFDWSYGTSNIGTLEYHPYNPSSINGVGLIKTQFPEVFVLIRTQHQVTTPISSATLFASYSVITSYRFSVDKHGYAYSCKDMTNNFIKIYDRGADEYPLVDYSLITQYFPTLAQAMGFSARYFRTEYDYLAGDSWSINVGLPQGCIDYANVNGHIELRELYIASGGSTFPVVQANSVVINYMPPNTPPVINSISPSTRVELRRGQQQVYTADVTDDEDDAVYSWRLNGDEVATTTTYTAKWEDISAGIYDVTLFVTDGEYDDTSSPSKLEIRAASVSGGSGSSASSVVREMIDVEQIKETTPKGKSFGQSVSDFFKGIGAFFRNLFGGR
jgi:hypothetical protein